MLEDAKAAGFDGTLSDQAAFAVAYIEGGARLDAASMFYWNAFGHLNTERPQAMSGILPIPFMSVVKYCEYYELNRIASDRLIKVIERVDAYYMGEAKRRQAANTK